MTWTGEERRVHDVPVEEERRSIEIGVSPLVRQRRTSVHTVLMYAFLSAVFLIPSIISSTQYGRISEATQQIRREAFIRQDQSCLLFERLYIENVDRLQRTYEYVLGLSPEQRREPLNAAVIAGVPNTEQATRSSRPPSFCDSPRVGRAEPPPRVPRRPIEIERLVS